jgi:hypothetical protein
MRRRHAYRYRIAVGKAFRQGRPGQTLGDDKGIVPESFKKFAQHFRLFGVLCHALHLSLQLLGGNWPLPITLQSLRVAQIICDFPFELRF